jgi:hypothetical protein
MTFLHKPILTKRGIERYERDHVLLVERFDTLLQRRLFSLGLVRKVTWYIILK